MWIEGPFTTSEAFKNMKQVTRPVEDQPTSLNVTKAAAHKERWREKKVLMCIHNDAGSHCKACKMCNDMNKGHKMLPY